MATYLVEAHVLEGRAVGSSPQRTAFIDIGD
jgi:hypothetical protein